MLRDGAVVVTGGGTAVGRDLVAGLHDRGVRAVGVEGRFESCAAALDALDAALAGAGAQRLEMLVHVPDVLDGPPRARLDTLDEAAWDAGAEAVLRHALWTSQAAFARMQASGGRIVFVTATASLVGAAGHVPLTTAMEGIRSLMKVAARQWGAHGITLNCLAIAVRDADVGPLAPALGRAIDTRRELSAVVAALTGDAGGLVTGATIPVDGGVVMTP